MASVADLHEDQSGTALMLMPVAVLIIMVMAAITVDRTLIVADQRRLVAVAQVAADDGAAIGADVSGLRGGGEFVFDPHRVEQAVTAAIAVHDDHDHPISVDWRLEGDEIVIELRQDVPRIFGAAIPGGARTTTVHARARSALYETDR